MFRRQPGRFVLFVVMLSFYALLTGCGGKGKVQSAAPMSSGGSLISIQAGSYKFSPSAVRVEKTGMIALEIKNVSGSEQNFTLKSPKGKAVASINIPPKSTIISNVELAEAGTYEFYSNKALKAGLGMKGRIIVPGS